MNFKDFSCSFWGILQGCRSHIPPNGFQPEHRLDSKMPFFRGYMWVPVGGNFQFPSFSSGIFSFHPFSSGIFSFHPFSSGIFSFHLFLREFSVSILFLREFSVSIFFFGNFQFPSFSTSAIDKRDTQIRMWVPTITMTINRMSSLEILQSLTIINNQKVSQKRNALYLAKL